MATGLISVTAHVWRLRMVGGVVNAAGDVEVERELNADEKKVLANADALELKITMGAKGAGSPTFSLDELQYSRDGTNWKTQEDISDTVIAAAGEYKIALSKPILDASHIRFVASSETLDGSNWFASSNFDIVCRVKDVVGR